MLVFFGEKKSIKTQASIFLGLWAGTVSISVGDSHVPLRKGKQARWHGGLVTHETNRSVFGCGIES